MARVRMLDVITGAAVVPQQPVVLGRAAAGSTHQLRRVRTQQNTAARRHTSAPRLCIFGTPKRTILAVS